jgi:hypothetical protein
MIPREIKQKPCESFIFAADNVSICRSHLSVADTQRRERPFTYTHIYMMEKANAEIA